MRTRYHFYEIRSSRAAELDGDAVKRSFQAAERHDYRLFLWQEPAGEVVHLQLLFGERWVDWRAEGGLTAGVTDREVAAMTTDRARGARSLAAHDDEALLLMRSLLKLSAFPEDIDAVVRRSIAAEVA